MRRAGDRGWLLEAEAPAAVAEALRARFGARLEEIVPGHETVLVVGDVSPDELEPVAATAASPPAGRRTIELPVVYDGEDLAEVASLAGTSIDEVVRIHASRSYTAAFLGFAPGFAYLVGLDERLVVPRRAEPRERVPAGSVAVAGPYTGVYPNDSPGGWRLLGRTDAVLFDAARTPPALVAAGDAVRFVPR
jgi:KipI family sensor histidine kinase inhibitor